MSDGPIHIGVSACLVGERVRYDGKHKLNPWIRDVLANQVELIPICPEVAIGLGVPRPPIELVGSIDAPHARGVHDTTLDVTEALYTFARRQVQALHGIAGYIFKSRSPSCGLREVPLRDEHGGVHLGRGLYAAAFVAEQPQLPAIEETDLVDARVRDHFIERVFVYHRWQSFVRGRVSPARLVDFHSAHKLLLMSHGASHYAALGRLVAGIETSSLRERVTLYGERFLQAFEKSAPRGRHADVLMHASGFLKNRISAEERNALREQIERFRAEEVGLGVPLALLRGYFQRWPHPWIARQIYLYPDAREFALRYGHLSTLV